MHTREVLYKKIGGRYVEATDPWASEGLREGAWLVTVRPGQTTMRQRVWPANAEVQAAMEAAKDAMVTAMREAAKGTPIMRTNTAREQRGINAYIRITGESTLTIGYKSYNDIVQAGIDALTKEMYGEENTKSRK